MLGMLLPAYSHPPILSFGVKRLFSAIKLGFKFPGHITKYINIQTLLY
jgi:hypothetical protein